MVNPLVAETKDSTQSYSGVSLLESANDLKSAIESGDWASVALGAVGTALDALGAAMDPFGAILAAGVGWLMEHVGPLKEALDGLAGDPDQIKAHAETWKNVAKELGEVGTDLTSMTKADTANWTGAAGDAYRERSADTANLITAAQQGADGASSGVQTAGEVVAAVRTLVRDIIAELVGHLISWALQVIATLGIGLAWVVPQVISAVVKTASQIANITKKLVKALKALVPLLKRAGDLFADAGKALKNLKSGAPKPNGKVNDLPKGPKDVDVPKEGKGDSTKASSADQGPEVGPPPRIGDGNGSPGSHGSPDATPGGPPIPKSPGGGGKPSGNSKTPPPNERSGPRGDSTRKENRWCESDPVDVLTGEVVATETDLSLAGRLGLVLERTHVSSYRAGRWFGANWSSTVDQRLEVDEENVRYFSADGMTLVYPLAAGTALPLEGPRLSLTPVGPGYRLDDPQFGQSLFFDRVAGSRRGVLPLVAVENVEADRIEVEYDRSGAPSALRHGDGRVVRLTTDRDRIVGVEVVGAGETVPVAKFGYDERGRLVEVVNSSGQAAHYDYDDDGRMTGWRDRTGTWYRYTYDNHGRCVRTLGPDGFFSGSFAYDRERLITVYTDSLGATTEYHFTEAKQLTRRVDALGNVTAYAWDRYDRLLARTDALGSTTSFGYDERGVLESVVRPDGSVLRVTDGPDGLTVEADAGDGTVLTRFYPRDEAPDPFEEPLGISAPFRSDRMTGQGGQPEEPRDRDLFGRARSVLNRSRQPVGLAWTVEGRERQRVQPSGVRETRRYDPEGNELEHVNGAGFATKREYGPFGLLTATIDESGARTEYAYDTELRLVAVTNPLGLRWTYRYDAAGRLVQETDFDGRTLRFAYDRAGRLVWSSNGAGEETEYRHDVLGNVIERRGATGTTRYTYDPLGRLSTASLADVELSIGYDAAGATLSESVDGRTLSYTRDADGTIRRRTPSGVDSVWTLDPAGVPVSLTIAGHTLRFGHDTGGRETTRTVDGRFTISHEFDADDNLVGQSVRGTAQPWQRRFTYRHDGLLTGIDDQAGPTRLVLDAVGRVVELHAPRGSEHYRYDPAGNVVDAHEPGAVPSAGARRYANNRLLAAGAVTFEYDQQGRVTARHDRGRVWRYVWDGHDRLIALATPEGDQWHYRYDPLGRRIAKQRMTSSPSGARVVAETHEFTWSGAVLAEQVRTDEHGTRHVTTWEYVPGDDRPVVQVERSSTVDERFFVIVTDLLGRPTDLLDPAGSLVWRQNAGLWGRETGPAATPLRFPGQYADAESGLHYNVYRYYDPATGRYFSQDPLGLGPAPNPVAYVDNPFAMSDPLGLVCDKKKGKGKATQDTPGGGGDAGKVPGGSKGETSASSHTHSLGTHDGVDVQVDSHQGKHQQGNSIFGLPKYTGGSGTKFPSYVNGEWHEKYFAPQVAKQTKEGTPGRIDADIAHKKSTLDEHAERRQELQYEGQAKQQELVDAKKELKNASPENKQAAQERVDAVTRERDDLANQYQEAKRAEQQAAQELKAAEDARANQIVNDYKKVPQEDGITYDITTQWDSDKGRWQSTYHANPADGNWDKEYGAKLGKKHGLPTK
ncbi:DUF6531 domain-containing protein [Amycolatopsis anabasis]|uniref:DUF6531 domain-containing protein n=1 Tax=Amycolatopsis anabasis TaxID=1840409 RepID=UPI00131CD948|nr:DUF6531 domain-containing protein [Amycolatopsis anabasis]